MKTARLEREPAMKRYRFPDGGLPSSTSRPKKEAAMKKKGVVSGGFCLISAITLIVLLGCGKDDIVDKPLQGVIQGNTFSFASGYAYESMGERYVCKLYNIAPPPELIRGITPITPMLRSCPSLSGYPWPSGRILGILTSREETYISLLYITRSQARTLAATRPLSRSIASVEAT